MKHSVQERNEMKGSRNTIRFVYFNLHDVNTYAQKNCSNEFWNRLKTILYGWIDGYDVLMEEQPSEITIIFSVKMCLLLFFYFQRLCTIPFVKLNANFHAIKKHHSIDEFNRWWITFSIEILPQTKWIKHFVWIFFLYFSLRIN